MLSLWMKTWFGPGLAVIIIGSLLSWVSSFVLYGFGELVVNSAIIAGKEGKIVVGGQSGNTVAPQNKSEKITALNNLKARGLISEEEYSRKLAELESKR
ncbi:MAG: SHOCT domain-containing protein [Acutalibacteraceae bacterium]